MKMDCYRRVEVPLSKLHFELYDYKNGDKIEMGDGIKTNNHMFKAWTDEIPNVAIRSVKFPVFSLTDAFDKESEPMAIIEYD